MRRPVLVAVLALATVAIATPIAWAGSPHFINRAFEIDRVGNTLTVSGKEAGLGDEEQVHIVLEATAQCINRGGHNPSAANKTSVSAEGDFPVQNGKALFTLTVTATFQPNCSPPMTVRFTNITVTDETSGISRSFTGTF